jgi:hypothetical protein
MPKKGAILSVLRKYTTVSAPVNQGYSRASVINPNGIEIGRKTDELKVKHETFRDLFLFCLSKQSRRRKGTRLALRLGCRGAAPGSWAAIFSRPNAKC